MLVSLVLCATCHRDLMVVAGSLAALTTKLPRQEITSHPSVKGLLEKGIKEK